MIIDGHCHLVEGNFSGEELVKSMDEDGVDKTIAFGDKVEGNDYVARAVRKFPDKIIGFSWVNPLQKNATEELRRSIEVLGLKGAKLHPYYTERWAPSNHELLDPILGLCANFEIPIIIHGADDTHPFEIEEMVRPFSEVTVVIAHMGLIWYLSQAQMVAKRNENILLDTALVYQEMIATSVKEVGADKIVMGTDKPADNTRLMLKKIELAVPNEDERSLITGGNYAKLLKLV